MKAKTKSGSSSFLNQLKRHATKPLPKVQPHTPYKGQDVVEPLKPNGLPELTNVDPSKVEPTQPQDHERMPAQAQLRHIIKGLK